MLQGNSRFSIDVLGRNPNGAILCNIFLAKDKSLAFKFDKDNREVMIDKISGDSESSFKFVLSLTEKLSDMNFVESS